MKEADFLGEATCQQLCKGYLETAYFFNKKQAFKQSTNSKFV